MKIKRRNLKSIIILILLVAFTGSMTKNINAFAVTASDIDMDMKGSINVKFNSTGDREVSGELMLIKVADIKENGDNGLEYVYTSEFDKCGLNIDGDIDDTFVNNLKAYIEDNEIKGYTKEIDSDGKISFTDLEIGMYFVMQTDTDSYYKISPFVITVPEEIDGEIYYDVDATPKTEVSSIEIPTVPEETETPVETTEKIPETTPEEKIPQTGLLVWPVVLLVLVGALLIGSGIMLQSGKSERGENTNEK
ncbi:MAG: hypothetical protein MR361_07135 [Clostridiales bacterium]|nr:hypothetical protein [Clostridiales bacterium]MDD6294231.1 hypothetical protein [Eubacteriales bacterium]